MSIHIDRCCWIENLNFSIFYLFTGLLLAERVILHDFHWVENNFPPLPCELATKNVNQNEEKEKKNNYLKRKREKKMIVWYYELYYTCNNGHSIIRYVWHMKLFFSFFLFFGRWEIPSVQSFPPPTAYYAINLLSPLSVCTKFSCRKHFFFF